MLGKYYSSKIKLSLNNIKQSFIYSIIGLIILIYISLFLPVYVLSGFPPNRAMAQIIFFMAIFVSYWGFILGYKIKIKSKFINISFYTSIIASILVILTTIFVQYPIVSEYSKALDKRINYLRKLKIQNQNKIIELSPLPSSGFLYSAEINENPNHFSNQHLKKGWFLNFNIKLKNIK